MIESCYIYFDNGPKCRIVLDITNMKQEIIHGNSNKSMRLVNYERISGTLHVWYESTKMDSELVW